MKERIKKISKKAFVVILVMVVLYNLVFDTVTMTKEELVEVEEKYNDFILFSSRSPIWYLEKIFPPVVIIYSMYISDIKLEAYMGDEDNNRNVVFYRWKASELKRQLEDEIIGDLEEFKQNGYINDYTYDKETMQLDIFIDTTDIDKYFEARHYIENEWQNDKLKTLRVLREIRGITYLEIHEVKAKVQENEISSKNEEPETEIKKYTYDEQEVDLLNKIITRSLEKKSFDLEDEDKIQGDSEDKTGGHICYLDLSDYNYITGKLDLSGFSKLKYVLIRGMKISEVVLPESLEYIDEKSFAYCERLEKIVIPENVKSFENPVFYGCKNLKEIVFEGNAPEILWEKEDIFGKVPEDLIIYRKKSAKGWQETVWDKYDVRIME